MASPLPRGDGIVVASGLLNSSSVKWLANYKQTKMSKTYCLLGDSSLDRNGESSKLTRVEYWYGIESTVEYTPEVSYALEREITEVAEASMSWCYQNGGRRVQEEETGGEYFVDASGRRLGITAMSSGPIDLPYSGGRSKLCHMLLRVMICS